MELYRLILGKWALNIGDLLKILKEAPCPRSLIKITSERLLNPKKSTLQSFFGKFFRNLYKIPCSHLSSSPRKSHKIKFIGHGGGIIKRLKRNSTYAILCMLCMVVAAVPISGAVGDQDNNANGENPSDGLQVGISHSDVQETQNVLQNKKPFGEGTDKILGNNITDDSLRLGSTGDEVKKLQQWLTDYGYYSGDVDGNFGEGTETAVRMFQEEAGLIVDGVVGNDTRKAMESWDKYLAEVEAASSEQTDDSYTADTSTASYSKSTTTKRSYAKAVRSYNRNYNTRSYSRSYSSYSSWSAYGDCWAISEAAYQRLTASGKKARIIQYPNSYVNNHRSVQYWDGGKWVDYRNVPTRGVPTSRKGAEIVIK